MLQKKLGTFRVVVGISAKKENLIWNVCDQDCSTSSKSNQTGHSLEKKTTLQMLLWEDKKQKPLESLIVISNEFFLDIVFVAALTILGQTGFRVRQEPAPCAWAQGSTEGLTGCENWPSDIGELKRSTTHTRIMSEVRSHFAALF